MKNLTPDRLRFCSECRICQGLGNVQPCSSNLFHLFVLTVALVCSNANACFRIGIRVIVNVRVITQFIFDFLDNVRHDLSNYLQCLAYM